MRKHNLPWFQTPEQRRATAEKIAELRREKFQADKNFELVITTLVQESIEKKISLEETVNKIQDSEERLLQLKDDLISRLVHFREIQKLEQQVIEQKTNQEKFDEQYRQTLEIISDLKSQENDRSKLVEAKRLLNEFYSDKEEEWTNFEKEEKQRDVKNVLGQYGVAMVHALIPNGAPSENTLLRSDISWQEKLKILLAFEPTISTSTISPEQQATWRNMGVLLSGGRVEVASPQDAGTKAKGLKEREVRQGHFSTTDINGQKKTIEKQLQDATSHRGGYNEVVVGNPEIAGFFVKVNEDNSLTELGDANAYVSPEDIFKTVRDMHLPLFVIKGGEVYRANPDEAEKVLDTTYIRDKSYKTIMKLGEKVPPAELSNLPTALNKEQQDQLVTEILDDSPFKLSMAEAHCTDAMSAGRETYVGVNFGKLNSGENFPTEIYQSSGRYETMTSYVGKEMKILSVVKSPDAIQRLVSIDGKLFTEDTNKRTGKRNLYDSLSEHLKIGSIVANVSNFFTYGTERGKETSIDSTTAYIDRMKLEVDTIKDLLSKAEKDSSEHRESRIEKEKNSLRQRAFHLYGYADEAGKNGDIESQEMANHLAAEVLPRETYDEIVKRRVGPNGEFKITKEDL